MHRLAADHQLSMLWPRLAEVNPGRTESSPDGSQSASPQAAGPLQHMLFHVLSPFRSIESFKYRRPNEMEQEGVHAGGREVDGGNNELRLRTCMASDSCQLVTEASTKQNSREDGSMGTSSSCCVIPVDLCGDPQSGMRTWVHRGYTMGQCGPCLLERTQRQASFFIPLDAEAEEVVQALGIFFRRSRAAAQIATYQNRLCASPKDREGSGSTEICSA